MTTPGLDLAFDAGAGRYDLLTRLNPGYHRHLACAGTQLARRLDTARPHQLLDLGCGSGILPLLLLTRSTALHMTGLELNPEAARVAPAASRSATRSAASSSPSTSKRPWLR